MCKEHNKKPLKIGVGWKVIRGGGGNEKTRLVSSSVRIEVQIMEFFGQNSTQRDYNEPTIKANHIRQNPHKNCITIR